MAAADDSATTGQKTHRYLRLSLVLIVFALLTGVALQSIVASWEPLTFGWNPLPSISHAFYTPARDVFVGGLIATSVILLALSGRGRPTTLLDICAVLAPLIAIIPTGIAETAETSETAENPGAAETTGMLCVGDEDCIPAEFIDGARAGVAVYAVAVVAAVVTMAVIRYRRRTPDRSSVLVSVIAVGIAAVVLALAFVPGLSALFPFNLWPVHSIHFVVTVVFFGVFAAVPILYARGPSDPDETPPTPRQRGIYRWIAGLLIVDLAVLVAAILFRQTLGETPVLLVGEATALILFACFWWVQTVQRWNDANPPSILAGRAEPGVRPPA